MPRNNFYNSTGTTEPDMRQELINMFDGLFPEVAKKQPGIIRKMRRDSNGNLTSCVCVDNVTGEPDKDHYCPYCLGEGVYWDEVWCDYYKVILRSDVGNATREGLFGPGLVNAEMSVFFLRYSYDLTKDDKIVEIFLNNDGTVRTPYKRKIIHRIGGLIPLRSDNAKLEFWKAACYEENVKFLNGSNG